MKKKYSVIVCLVIALALMVGSLAYFSDNAVTSASGTAGTVAIALDSHIDWLDEYGMDILGPGDREESGFTVTNVGNKSIDVRTTIALTVDSEHYDLVFSGDSDTQSEFDLYLASDVDMGYLFEKADGSKYIATEALEDTDVNLGNVGNIPKAGAKPIQAKSVEDNVITYIIPEYSLNGNSDMYAEYESIEGIDTYSHLYDYVLVFHRLTGNTWQDCHVMMDVVVEAKQHENTQAGWEIVAQETVTQGSLTLDVVDREDVLTDINGNMN